MSDDVRQEADRLRAGRLTQHGPTFRRMAVFICDCGTYVAASVSNVKSGSTSSCGCLGRQRKLKHGGSSLPEYNSWKSMIARCTNKSHMAYHRYGGAGIKVCDRWLENFQNFAIDMGRKPSTDHSLDRIDNAGHYEPENCRWATRFEQAANSRSVRIISINGVSKSMSDWARGESPVSADCIYRRLARGWDEEMAVMSPKEIHSSRRSTVVIPKGGE